MSKIQQLPVRASIPTGGYVVITEPNPVGDPRSTFAKVLPGTVVGVPSPSDAMPLMDSTATPGVSALYSRGDHRHATDTSRYAAANPAGYQTAADITASLVPYAKLASPALTGIPTAPTASPGTNTTQLASTAFVGAAVQAAGGYVEAPSDGSVYGRLNAAWSKAAPLTLAAANVGRNLIHNPLFNIVQRGTGTFSSGYTADRWRMDFTLDTFVVQPQALAAGNPSFGGDEAASTVLVANVTAGNAGATAFSLLSQLIEDVRRLSGKTVTISFWAYANVGTPKIGVGLRQFFGTGGSPSTMVYVNATPVTVTTTPTRYSVTIPLPSIGGKTLGTNNDHYTRLGFFLSAGANTNTIAGGIGVQTAQFGFWGVQLEIGSVATPLEETGPAAGLGEVSKVLSDGIHWPGSQRHRGKQRPNDPSPARQDASNPDVHKFWHQHD